MTELSLNGSRDHHFLKVVLRTAPVLLNFINIYFSIDFCSPRTLRVSTIIKGTYNSCYVFSILKHVHYQSVNQRSPLFFVVLFFRSGSAKYFLKQSPFNSLIRIEFLNRTNRDLVIQRRVDPLNKSIA